MSNRGLTIIEILVTIVVLSVALLSVAQTLNKAGSDYAITCDKFTAYHLADDAFQEIKSFVRRPDNIEYSGTRLSAENILEFAGTQTPPENILKIPMNEYQAFTRRITVNKFSGKENIKTDSLYEISVEILKNKKQLVELKWVEYFEE